MRVIVDFHSAEDDRIFALRSHVRDELVLEDFGTHSIVLLDDCEGHTATGVVDFVDDSGLISINVLWQTWRDDSVYNPEWMKFSGFVETSIERDRPTQTSTLQSAA